MNATNDAEKDASENAPGASSRCCLARPSCATTSGAAAEEEAPDRGGGRRCKVAALEVHDGEGEGDGRFEPMGDGEGDG